MRLWRVNLYHGCSKCNGRLGNRIKWSIRAIQLLVIYFMIKLITYVSMTLVIVILCRYIYLDINYNASTITDQMQYELIEYYQKLRQLA